MKNLIKFFPVAVAALTITSCNSDDLASGTQNAFGENAVTLEAIVDAPKTDGTRAYVTASDSYDWAVGDELRVYDSKMQKYDMFTYQTAGTAKAFVLSNAKVSGSTPQYVSDEEYASQDAYALFGGQNITDEDVNKISYNGWKPKGTAGVPTALVFIPAALKYKEANKSDDNAVAVYKSTLPLWGKVSAPATENAKFSTNLHYLTAFAAVSFENANKIAAGKRIKEVRMRALKKKSAFTSLSAKDQAGILANLKKGITIESTTALDGAIGNITVDNAPVATYATTPWSTYFEIDNSKPLNGWFDAELEDNGTLVNTTDAAINQTATAQRGTLTIDVYNKMVKNLSVVNIPIICQDYQILVIDYNTEDATTTYKVAGAMKDNNAKFAGAVGVKRSTTVSLPNQTNLLDGMNTLNITSGIMQAYDGSSDAQVAFNVDANGIASTANVLTVQTGNELLNTIYLPQITERNLEIRISGKATGTVLNNDLTIADMDGVTSQGTGKVTLIMEHFANPGESKKVIINSKANIILSGDFSPANVTVEPGENCTSLTLGIAGETADNDFKYGTKTFTATKGNLTVADVVNTMNVTYNNANGTLETASALANVTVTNASSATVKAGVSTKLSTAKNITIEAASTDEIEALELEKTVSTITLKGGIINAISETSTASKRYAAGAAITLNSEGLSAIKTVNAFTNAVKWTFNSKLNVPATGAATYYMTAVNATSATQTANIYTAAQLAGVANITALDFDLKTNITELTNWQSPNLTKEFRGGKAAENGLTIKGVDAPLFGEVSATIKNVDLTVAIDKKAVDGNEKATVVGALGKTTVTNAVSVLNVDIKGSIKALNKVGGVFGTTGIATTFGDGLDNSTNGVKVSVDFTNNTVYSGTVGTIATAGTFGKFVGQAGAAKVTINKECSVGQNAFDKSALHFNYNRLSNLETGVFEWQYEGNTTLIGYSPSATDLVYGGVEYTTAGTDVTTTEGTVTTHKIGRITRNNTIPNENANTNTDKYEYTYHNKYVTFSAE